MSDQGGEQRFFELAEVGKWLPEHAETILKDVRMVDDPSASCRLIRIYRPLPLHFHRSSNENVYVLNGKARFRLGDQEREIAAGMFVHFPKLAVHGIPEILEHPLIVLTIDTPCRPSNDVIFLNPSEADTHSFNGDSRPG